MSVNGDVSEQIVRLSLEGFEVIAKLTGAGAKNAAAMIYTIMKDKKMTKGKIKLNNMLRASKNLKVFTLREEDLKIFSRESKSYGISYCALVGKNHKGLDGMVDILVKEEDASRINRVVQRFNLITTNTANVTTEVSKERNQTIGENFNMAKIEKSPLSEPSSMNTKEQVGVTNGIKKTSVRKELAMLKIEAKKLDELKTKEKAISKGVFSDRSKDIKCIKSNR